MNNSWPTLQTSYLGNKGYTISKSELTPSQLLALKDMLMVKPFTPGAPPTQVVKLFPAYRESANKLYVPRYFGQDLFGPAISNKMSEGLPMNPDVVFQGSLREYQAPVVAKFLHHVSNNNTSKENEGEAGLLELPCAWGKTSASLYISSKLKRKTMVIVHKEFLMNQWIERIRQFLPMAKIGKIQCPVIDVEGKDIVLVMLQSLVMKDYPASLFETFGFTILDEVHHISSETFSNALFKIVTPKMLGLSATMERKDGTTNVFKMFLGKVVEKVERESNQSVRVHAITFRSKDEDFNETVLDYRGKPQISTMISKLCNYSNRTEFVLQVLTDFIATRTIGSLAKEHKEAMDRAVPPCQGCGNSHHYLVKNTCCNVVKYCLSCVSGILEQIEKGRPKCPECHKVLKYEQHYIENPFVQPLEQRHTLVLSHNLNVLHYLYNKIVCHNLASVGYYVGGMKEADLKKSEKKQVILATFSMASEALDIPTLNAEFLITPKTDVVQSVGRILRAKHAFSSPVIVDIKDTHSVFMNQWQKRKRYFKSQHYHITECDSNHYRASLFQSDSDYKSDQTSDNNKQSEKTTSSSEDEEEQENEEEEEEKPTCWL